MTSLAHLFQQKVVQEVSTCRGLLPKDHRNGASLIIKRSDSLTEELTALLSVPACNSNCMVCS